MSFSIHPYYSLGWVFLVSYFAVFFVCAFFLRKKSPKHLVIYALAFLAFVPTLITHLWCYWFFHCLAVSGYVGVQDPQEIMWNHIQGALSGLLLSAFLLLATGVLAFCKKYAERDA